MPRIPVIGTMADVQCAVDVETHRAIELVGMLGTDVPPCTRPAASLWLLARTSLHRGEVFQRALIAWAVWTAVIPCLRAWMRAEKSAGNVNAWRLGDRVTGLVHEVTAWCSFLGTPRGAEHWEPLAAWWSAHEAASEVAYTPRARWRICATSIAADLAYAAEAVCCASPRALADALRRIVDNAIAASPDALLRDTTRERIEERIGVDLGDDLRALVDGNADAAWNALAVARLVASASACLFPSPATEPSTWDEAQGVADAAALVVHGDARMNRATAILRAGLGPIEAHACMLLGITAESAARLRTEGYLTLVLREAAYAPALRGKAVSR